MNSASLGILFVILCSLEAVTVFDQHADDEYILEHEVLYKDAIEEARKLKLYPGSIPGCKECSTSEMTYCQDGVLSDHCCCDGRYNEVFRFVAHECQVGPEPCTVKAGDCAEYARLRECCCHKYQATLWKYLASGASSVKSCSNAWVLLPILRLLF